jgi:hypothetical protein
MPPCQTRARGGASISISIAVDARVERRRTASRVHHAPCRVGIRREWDWAALDPEAAGREAGAYITIARRVARYADRVGIEAPIANVIADVLEGLRTPDQGLGALMKR